MICPRCQSDNKPGRFSCWNCLSPLDGPLAQKFAQRPPDPTGAGGGGKAKKPNQMFWIIIGILSLVLMVGALVVCNSIAGSAKSSLPSSEDLSKYKIADTSAPPPDTSAAPAGGAAKAGADSGDKSADKSSDKKDDKSSSDDSSDSTKTKKRRDPAAGME